MEAKTIPIVCETTPSPKLPENVWLRRMHAGIALLTGLILPAVAATVATTWFLGDKAPLPDVLAMSVICLVLIAMAAHTVAACNGIGMLVLGVPGLAGASLLFGNSNVAVVLLLLLTMFAGMAVGRVVYLKLRARTGGAQDKAENDKLNPKCSSCHAKHFCPYQPGGPADAYTPKQGS